MTQEQVATLVERELASYRYEWVPGLVGDPVAPRRVAGITAFAAWFRARKPTQERTFPGTSE